MPGSSNTTVTSKLKLILNHDKADSISKISTAYMIYSSPTRVLFLRWPHLPMVICLTGQNTKRVSIFNSEGAESDKLRVLFDLDLHQGFRMGCSLIL